jgi:tetratricopeptide (TPR) repeat protein
MDRRNLDAALLQRTDGWIARIWAAIKIAGLSTISALAIAAAWAWMHRGEVVLVPFEGENGSGAALRLGRDLEQVALGSTSGIATDTALRLGDGDGPPALNIPGVGLSLADLVGFLQRGPLAQTRVHGVLVKEAAGYQVSAEVFGRAGPAAIRTEVKPDADGALVQAAEQLYGLLDPIALAAYLYSRNPRASLDVIHRILSDPHHRPEDEAIAYRVWGLILRDQADFEAARGNFEEALRLTPAGPTKARVLVDLGHAYLWDGRSEDAAKIYAGAAALDPTWEAPHTFYGDALRESGDIPGAIREYEAAIRLNALSADPWLALARQYNAAGRYGEAADAYRHVRWLGPQPGESGSYTDYALGDVLFRMGCDGAAAAAYDRAVATDPAFENARYDWQRTLACEVSPARADIGAYPWRIEIASATPGLSLCTSTAHLR